MPSIGSEIIEVQQDLIEYNLWNYTDLLKKYASQMEAVVTAAGGQVSDLPLTSRYWKIRNKYQYVVAKFKP